MANKTGDVIVDVTDQPLAVRRMRIMTGGAQLLLDCRMDLGEAGERCIKVLVAARAEGLALLLQNQSIGEAMTHMAGLTVLFRHGIVFEPAVEFLYGFFVAGIAWLLLGAQRT